ncbi:MAG TPA: hypothetical protein VGD30_13080 [Telluria sp.]
MHKNHSKGPRDMAPKLIELATVVKMASEREVTAAAIVEATGGWYVRITLGADERMLAAPDGTGPRRWESAAACAAFLARETGILHLDISTMHGDLVSPLDQDYGDWLQSEVQRALEDPRAAVASDEVERDFDQIKSAFRKRLTTGQN